MRNFFSITALIIATFTYGQKIGALVTKEGKPYITQQDFKKKFGYTITHDRSRSKAEVLDYYLTLKVKSDKARELKLDREPYFVNSMFKFIEKRKPYYLKQDSFYQSLYKQLAKRMKSEVELKQYIVNDLSEKKAQSYQLQFEKDPLFFNSIKTAKRMDQKYIRPGELPYDLEQEIYKNLKKGRVLSLIKAKNGEYIYTIIKDIRPYSGIYKFQWLLIKDTSAKGKQKIEELYSRAVSGEDFAKLVKKNSEDEKSKNIPFIEAPGTYLGKQTYHVINPLKKNEITKPFKTKYGLNIVKLLRHDIKITDQVISRVFKASEGYQGVLKVHKVEIIDKKLKPIEYKQSIVKVLKDQSLIDLLKNKKLSKNQFKVKWDSLISSKRPKQVIKFNDGSVYNSRNFLFNNGFLLRRLYMGSQPTEKSLNKFISFALFKAKLYLFDNIQEELNPKFRKEKELTQIGMLTDLYDKHIEAESLKDTVNLKRVYDSIKTQYKWKKRVELQVAYCGKDEQLAQQVKKQFQKGTTLSNMQNKFSSKNVYFRHLKRELSSSDLPKGYSVSKKVRIYHDNGDYFVVKTVAKIPAEVPTYKELESEVKQEWKKIYLKASVKALKKSVKINQPLLNNL